MLRVRPADVEIPHVVQCPRRWIAVGHAPRLLLELRDGRFVGTVGVVNCRNTVDWHFGQVRFAGTASSKNCSAPHVTQTIVVTEPEPCFFAIARSRCRVARRGARCVRHDGRARPPHVSPMRSFTSRIVLAATRRAVRAPSPATWSTSSGRARISAPASRIGVSSCVHRSRTAPSCNRCTPSPRVPTLRLDVRDDVGRAERVCR